MPSCENPLIRISAKDQSFVISAPFVRYLLITVFLIRFYRHHSIWNYETDNQQIIKLLATHYHFILSFVWQSHTMMGQLKQIRTLRQVYLLNKLFSLKDLTKMVNWNKGYIHAFINAKIEYRIRFVKEEGKKSGWQLSCDGFKVV